jgi:tetratricopeptide (TPR) repeat protein
VVIGRTQENDIVLNHKSISRHHAKVIRDGDRYVVVDLESANGVRVNGAEYERVELQSGDMLELGHVRLRFVTADDAGNYESDFRFRGNRKPIYIAAGAAVVLIAGGLLVFGGKKETAKLPPPLPAAKVAVTPLPPTATPPAAATPPAPATPPPDSAPALLVQAKKAYEQQKWGDALALVDKAVKAQPLDTEDAEELRKVVEAEQQNGARFEALQHASDIKDYEAVLRGSPEISEGSFYKSKTKALEEDARGKLIARHLDTAEKRRADGNCSEVRREANAVLAIDAENQAAQDLIARCAKTPKPAAVATKPAEEAPAEASPPAHKPARTVATATPPAPKPAAPAPVTPPPAAATPKPVAAVTPAAAPAPKPAKPAAPRPAAARGPAEGAPSSADGDALMQEAQDAWLKGQYSAAIDASRKALRAKPGLTRAYQIIAVCSCSLRDAESASKAYERLDDRNKQLVKQLCAKSGITIE